MRFAHSKAADRKSRKIEIEKLPRTFATQIGKRRALHDAELPLAGFAVALRTFLKTVARAASPFRGALERGFRLVPGRRRFDALIEHHGDVRSQRELNLRGFLGRKEMFRTVEMRAEAHALSGYFSQFGEAEDLIAAGIREDGARPGHELVQTAEFADESVPRAQIKMIGVCEDDFGAELFEGLLRQRFDGSLCADGHEEGSLDSAVRGEKAAAAGAGRIGLPDFKRIIHLLSVSGEDEGPADSADHIGRPDAKGDRVSLGPL